MKANSSGEIPELLGAPGESEIAPSGEPHWSGPRWWWAGHLDVEGLALGSVLTFSRALSAYGASVGNPLDVVFSSAGVAASFASWTHLRVDGKPVQGFSPLSGFRQAGDGWVRLHANYPHHVAALLTSLGATTPDAVDAVIRDRSAADVEKCVTEAGGVAVRVRTPREWESTMQAGCLRKEPWIRFQPRTVLDPSPPKKAGDATTAAPLAGIRVLDLTRVIAGPSATRLLGALGADVLRIDSPGMAELWDMHMDTGFDKRSALANFAVRDDLERVRELILHADVILTGYRGESLNRFGLDIDFLEMAYPQLAIVTFDAWGDHGPWANRRGFDSIVQAATGISSLYGSEEDGHWKPGALPVQVLDHAVGMGAAAAVLTLLRGRNDGMTGSAHLSLARTAHELMSLPKPPTGEPTRELTPPLCKASGDYGDTTYVPPPLHLDGHQLDYKILPRRYGSSELSWDCPPALART